MANNAKQNEKDSSLSTSSRGNVLTVCDWDKMPLGFVHDDDLAAFLVCSVDAVAYARRERGIPAKKRRVPKDRWSKRPGFVDVESLKQKIENLKKENKKEKKKSADAEAEARRLKYSFNKELSGLRAKLGLAKDSNKFTEKVSLLLQENHNLRLMLAEKLATWKTNEANPNEEDRVQEKATEQHKEEAKTDKPAKLEKES